MSTRRRAKVVLTPMALDERQRTRQGIQWLLKAAEKGRKGGIPREQRIAKEVFAVLEGTSEVFKWIEERHKVATANRCVSAFLGFSVLRVWYPGTTRRHVQTLMNLMSQGRGSRKVLCLRRRVEGEQAQQ